jgi:hypothetical protein
MRPYDQWQNSGYGLYMAMRLCMDEGEFFLGSHDAGFLVNSANHANLDFGIHGTAIRILINTSNLDRISESLGKFAREGEQIATKLRGANKVGASVASLTLSKDLHRPSQA